MKTFIIIISVGWAIALSYGLFHTRRNLEREVAAWKILVEGQKR